MMRAVKICCCLVAVIGTLAFEGLHAYSTTSLPVIAKTQHASSHVANMPTPVVKAQTYPVRLVILSHRRECACGAGRCVSQW